MGNFDENCLSCQSIQGKIRLSKAPRILETNYWVVETPTPISVKGWVILAIKRHCIAIHELTTEEMVELGKLSHIICQALHSIMKTEKEYLIQFSESDGFPHLHLHIVARMPEWPEALMGPRVMKAMGDWAENPISTEEATALALEMREYLLKHLPADLIIK